jgi:predicted alpha/beta-fold hydrolase
LRSSYQAPWWLPGGHAQTIWSALRPAPQVALRRERWDTPDGDFIDLDWADAPDAAQTLVLFHGLEGSSDSHYARSIAAAAVERGWRSAIVHFRGCSGEPNRLSRAYHSGDSDEADWVLRRLARERGPLFATGISLGGNVLLKWLGERGGEAQAMVRRAAAVSAPLDLAAADRALSAGFPRLVYARMFLRTLKQKSLDKLARHPGAFDGARAAAARTLYEFDDAVTAPLHGFAGAADYYARASSGPLLRHIRVPTLVLNALNDPFLPRAALQRATREASADVLLEFPSTGGHVGFIDGGFPGHHGWLAQRILGFLAET